MAEVQDIVGTWRMISWTRESKANGEVTDAMGPDPVGYISYHADGRMMASVFRRDRIRREGLRWTDAEKVGLFDTMLAYVASYTLEADRVVHHVEAAWNPDWEMDLSRPCALDGRRLVISGAPGIDPTTGEEVVYRMEFDKM